MSIQGEFGIPVINDMKAGIVKEGAVEEGGRRGPPKLFEVNRNQMLLHPVDVEKLINPEHAARAIWEFVGRLEMSRYYDEIRTQEGEAGGPTYDPRLLVAIWAYAYSKGVSSAREIERLCEYDPAYQWLTGMGKISHHTLSDFRVKHKEALNELFVEILGLLSAEGLVSLERVAHDGTKVKAKASGNTFRREKKIRAYLELARKQVEEMGDPREEEKNGPRVTKARERVARERKARLERSLEELAKIAAMKGTDKRKREARASVTDPEARIMKQSNGGYAPSYNVQISTETSNGIVVGVKATSCENDFNELAGAVKLVEENTGGKPKQFVADAGYTTRANVLAMAEKGMDYYGSLEGWGARGNRRGEEECFNLAQFTYNVETNRYICRNGKPLYYNGREEKPGAVKYFYRAEASSCAECEYKSRCCPRAKKKGRAITRVVEDERITAFRRKMGSEEAKAVYKDRAPIAEFTNAWLKEKIGLRQFRVVGLEKANVEAIWACIAYNMAQWLRLRWRPRFAVA